MDYVGATSKESTIEMEITSTISSSKSTQRSPSTDAGTLLFNLIRNLCKIK